MLFNGIIVGNITGLAGKELGAFLAESNDPLFPVWREERGGDAVANE